VPKTFRGTRTHRKYRKLTIKLSSFRENKSSEEIGSRTVTGKEEEGSDRPNIVKEGKGNLDLESKDSRIR